MRRKIIKQGHNTLTITLPSKWAKNFNVKAGDEIDISEKDNGLLLTTERKNESLKTEINLANLDIPTIWKYFMSVYREGYDEVLVKFGPELILENPYKFFTNRNLDIIHGKESVKKTPIEFIQDIVGRFIGYEIINYDKNSVVVKEMSSPSSKEFDNALRRIFLLLEQMAEEICETLQKNNIKFLHNIPAIDINVDKFHDYCIRILNKIGNKDSKKTALLFSTLYFLELIGDEFKNIARHLIYDFSKENYENLKEITESIKEQLSLFYQVFYKFDTKKIIEMSELDKERFFGVNELQKKLKKDEEREIWHHLRIITRYLNALSELRIEMEF